MSKKIDSLKLKGPDGKAMRDQHNLVTEKAEKLMWLMDEEESYDIPPSERSKLLNEVKSEEDKDNKWWKDFIMGEPKPMRSDPRKHKFRMFEEISYVAGVDPYINEYPYIPAESHKGTLMEESTPKSPDHRGRLRPGKGILEQIRESGNMVTYRSNEGHTINVMHNELFDGPKKALFTPPGVDKRERRNSVKYLKLSTLTQKILDWGECNT